MDYLKTTEGSSLSINTLIDMASQARRLFLLYFLYCLASSSLSVVLAVRKVSLLIFAKQDFVRFIFRHLMQT